MRQRCDFAEYISIFLRVWVWLRQKIQHGEIMLGGGRDETSAMDIMGYYYSNGPIK